MWIVHKLDQSFHIDNMMFDSTKIFR